MKQRDCIRFAKIFSVILVLISICLLLMWWCTRDYSSTDIADYAIYAYEVDDAEYHLPFGAALGDYSSMNSITLILSYEDSAFSDAVELVNSSYEFFEEAPENMSEAEAEVNGVVFKVAYTKSSDYPRWFMSVGVDTEKQRIIYLYHLDIETHEIESFEAFIKESYNLDGL